MLIQTYSHVGPNPTKLFLLDIAFKDGELREVFLDEVGEVVVVILLLRTHHSLSLSISIENERCSHETTVLNFVPSFKHFSWRPSRCRP